MGWKLRNRGTGFEIPLSDQAEVNQDALTYLARLPFDRVPHAFSQADYELVEDFDFPTKLFAIIQCESVTPGGKPGLFCWDAHEYWATPRGELYSAGYLRDKFQNFKVLFEGVDES